MIKYLSQPFGGCVHSYNRRLMALEANIELPAAPFAGQNNSIELIFTVVDALCDL